MKENKDKVIFVKLKLLQKCHDLDFVAQSVRTMHYSASQGKFAGFFPDLSNFHF